MSCMLQGGKRWLLPVFLPVTARVRTRLACVLELIACLSCMRGRSMLVTRLVHEYSGFIISDVKEHFAAVNMSVSPLFYLIICSVKFSLRRT